MHAQPARCMHAKTSLTSANAKLGHSHTKNNYCMYMSIELSQLMLNLYLPSRARSFSHHAVDLYFLCECYDLYDWNIDFSLNSYVG